MKQSLKNIFYLDEYKMYSAASQLFEGFASEVVRLSEKSLSETDHQKGEIGTGNILADMASEKYVRAEKRFLYDYAYIEFEDRLEKDNLIFEVDDTVSVSSIQQSGKPFIKVTGYATIIDIVKLKFMLENYQNLASSLAGVTALNPETASKKKTTGGRGRNPDPNKKAKQEATEQLIGGLSKEFLKDLCYLVNYGFGNTLEIQLSVPNRNKTERNYIAILKEDFLREAKETFISKHSMYPDFQFTMLGRVSKIESNPTDGQHDTSPEIAEKEMLRSSILNMLHHVDEFDRAIGGSFDGDIRIDPIAVYQD